MTLGPEQADRLALACIWWARPPRRGPWGDTVIRGLAGPDSDLSNSEKWDVADRFHAADQLTDSELEARMISLGGKALLAYPTTTPALERKDPRYQTTALGYEKKVALLSPAEFDAQCARVMAQPDVWPAGEQAPTGGDAVDDRPDPGLLARAIAAGKAALAAGYGPQPDVCKLCANTAPDETRNGRCRHYVSPAELERKRAYARDPQRLVEQAKAAQAMGVSSYSPVVTLEHKITVGARLAERGLRQ